MVTILVERIVRTSPRSLMDRIWAGAEWRIARSDIKGLVIEYDDGQNQSVQICVAFKNDYSALTIMRFRDSISRISFFYSRPPHGVVHQSGMWEARSIESQCTFRLVRNLRLQRRKSESDISLHAREAAYGSVLKEHLSLVLDSVARHESRSGEL